MEISIAAKFICNKRGGDIKYTQNVIELLEDGATIPFIARYRKEKSGGIDEVGIEEIKNLYAQYLELEKRKKTVIESIKNQDKLSDQLHEKIVSCNDIHTLEDIYLPYKPKKTTKAAKAKAKGLEPLAAIIMKQDTGNIFDKASRFVKNDVDSEEDALQGARDIIAEWVNENVTARNRIRRIVKNDAYICSKLQKGKEIEGEKYKDYFEFRELLKRCPSHRMLALRRGETEGILKINLEIDTENAIEILKGIFIRAYNNSSQQIELAIRDSYKRLLLPSIETEYMAIHKQKADEEAIKVFSENLRQLLLAAPLGNKKVLGLDPGFRTGCKLVCLDETGALIHNETIYPHPPQNEKQKASAKLAQLVEMYKIEAIAIGNGTASRETENFVTNVHFDRKVQVFVVNESGASIYSASKIGREEFPDYDITVRGAVSIGRRLIDPLAELVKIDPKSIGVGQYQHDVDQTKLKTALDQVVESCVNNVGVNVNTASKYLLTHVSGLGASLAENVINHINEHGVFKSRDELKKVKRMGAKAYEQCAAFLRISNSTNPLDNSAVHPESYYIVNKIAKDLGIEIKELIANEQLCDKIDAERYVDKKTGLITIKDIITELKKPRRDPRSVAKAFSFAENINTIDDLELGMELPAIVTNLTNFGAFVDIGVHQDGLVHISEISDRYITNPADVLKLYEHIRVKVIELDKVRKRISLSIRQVHKDK